MPVLAFYAMNLKTRTNFKHTFWNLSPLSLTSLGTLRVSGSSSPTSRGRFRAIVLRESRTSDTKLITREADRNFFVETQLFVAQLDPPSSVPETRYPLIGMSWIQYNPFHQAKFGLSLLTTSK